MFLVFTRRQLIWFFGLFALILFYLFYTLYSPWFPCFTQKTLLPENEVLTLINHIFYLRDQALLEENLPALASLYDRNTRSGVWAYEHHVKKMKYIHNWCYKQGAELSMIRSLIRLRRIGWREGIRVTFMASTEYYYTYPDEPTTINMMRIGTYHSLDLIEKDDDWLIRREWYTDPFADALEMKNEQAIADRVFIPSQKPRDLSNQDPRRTKAVAYADNYCGAAANEEQGLKYNPKYKNYNYSGGDCANFVSQVLYEGGGFRKTGAWNYGKGASRAWINAHAFHQYMLNSGRASRIAYGTYSQVLKASYQLLPGDYVAYEKKGKVTHVSVVTGADSKGYSLTNSHNADRYRVPWDLGYGNKTVRFYLVRVHY